MFRGRTYKELCLASLLVIGGFGGMEASAAPGEVWERADVWQQPVSDSFDGRHGHTSIVFDGKIWVIGGLNEDSTLNDVWYSEDGENWTQATDEAAFSARTDHTSFVFEAHPGLQVVIRK